MQSRLKIAQRISYLLHYSYLAPFVMLTLFNFDTNVICRFFRLSPSRYITFYLFFFASAKRNVADATVIAFCVFRAWKFCFLSVRTSWFISDSNQTTKTVEIQTYEILKKYFDHLKMKMKTKRERKSTFDLYLWFSFFNLQKLNKINLKVRFQSILSERVMMERLFSRQKRTVVILSSKTMYF